ncbi:nitroreductase family protein [Candidatus Woesearchaeota archaeon]|nr:MAG: nitroreductase family protein [Candidatus Woesearchaeota archaeon]
MDALACIFTRRSIRSFTEVPIEFDKLMTVLDAGNHAPSSGNLQNWKFILITGNEDVRKLRPFCADQECFATAQAGIVVVGEHERASDYYGLRGERLFTVQNCAAAMENMLLAAHALGLGAVWIGSLEEEKVASVLDVPESARVQGIVLLGYPAEPPEPKVMRELPYQVFFGRFGRKYTNVHWYTRDFSVEWDRRIRAGKSRLERLGVSLGKGLSGLREGLQKKKDNKEALDEDARGGRK